MLLVVKYELAPICDLSRDNQVHIEMIDEEIGRIGFKVQRRLHVLILLDGINLMTMNDNIVFFGYFSLVLSLWISMETYI